MSWDSALHMTLWEEIVKPYKDENPSLNIGIQTSGKETTIYIKRGRFWKRQHPLIVIQRSPHDVSMEVLDQEGAHADLVGMVEEKVEFFRSLIPEPEPTWEQRLERDDLSVLTAKNKLIGILYGLEEQTVILPEHLDIVSPNKPRSRRAAFDKVDEEVFIRTSRGRVYVGRNRLLEHHPEARDIYDSHPKLQVETERIQHESPPLTNSNYQYLLTKKKEDDVRKELGRLKEKKLRERGETRRPDALEYVRSLPASEESTTPLTRTPSPKPSLAKDDRIKIDDKIRIVVPEESDRELYVEVFTDLKAKMMESIDITPDVARVLNLQSLEANRMGKREYGYTTNIAGRNVVVYVSSMFRVDEGCFMPEISRMTFTTFFIGSMRDVHDDLIPDYLKFIHDVDGIKYDKESGIIEVPKRGYMSRNFIEGFGRYMAQVEMLETRGGELRRINKARKDMDSDDPETRRKGKYDLPNRYKWYTPKRVARDSEILGRGLADALEKALCPERYSETL